MTTTVRREIRHEVEPIKGSRFTVDVAPISDEAQARALLNKLRAEFPDASHHCSAWRIATPAIDRASDDGEPAGSAGRPILAQLTGRNLVDTAVVVTRWFGGTKLGVGGLVRAYSGAAGEALDIAELHPWVVMDTVSVRHEYAHADPIERLVTQLGGEFVERTFEAQVRSVVRIANNDMDTFKQSVANITNGAFQLEE